MKALLVLVALCGIAAADVHTNKAAKVTLDVPKTYKMTEQDDVMRGESEDKAVALIYWNVGTSNFDDAIKKLTGELYSAVGGLSWEQPKTEKVNGLEAQWIDGKGHSLATQLDIRVVFAGPTATKKYVMVVGIVDRAKADAHKAEIAAILKSLKPAK